MLLAVTFGDVVIAFIAATPPTIAAVAALLHARNASNKATDAAASAQRVDRAVNQQAPGEANLLDRVKSLQGEATAIRDEQAEQKGHFYDLHSLVLEHLKAHTKWERWVERELDDKQDRP